MTRAHVAVSADWTVGRDGRSNTSDAFVDAVEIVARLMRNHHLGDDVNSTAGLIVAQLAHRYGFGPLPPTRPILPSEKE